MARAHPIGEPPHHRCFIALELPVEAREQLVTWTQAALGDLPRSVLRWLPEENLHLTLHFLGAVATDRLESAEYATREGAKSAAFELRLRGLGCFPHPRKPRVVWVGVDEEPSLARLHDACANALEARGFHLENRPFHPHLTVAYVRRRASSSDLSRLAKRLDELERRLSSTLHQPTAEAGAGGADGICVCADTLALFASQLHRDGARHRALLRVRLADAAAAGYHDAGDT